MRDGGWEELEWVGGEQDAGGDQGMFTDADGVIGDNGEVYHTVDVEMTCFWGIWGEQDGWGMSRGCSAVSRCILRCSGAAVHSPEWCRAGNSGVIDNGVDNGIVCVGGDVAMAVGSGCTMGDWGANWR